MVRPTLAVLAALLLSASLAGCLERRGTLAIDLVVSPDGAIREFSRVNLTLHRVLLDARTVDPEPVLSREDRVELVAAVRTSEVLRVFEQEVRSDTYDRITLTTPPGAQFQGTLTDGTTVAVVVPNGVIVQTRSFEVPRGGAVTYTFSIQVLKNFPGFGTPTYSIVEDPGGSGVSTA